jgi:hypothetical protein
MKETPTMQLKMKIVHVTGCFSLVDTDGAVHGPGHVIQTAFYTPGDEADKSAKYEQLIAFGNGVTEGWTLARSAIGLPVFHTRVEELGESPKSKTLADRPREHTRPA